MWVAYSQELVAGLSLPVGLKLHDFAAVAGRCAHCKVCKSKPRHHKCRKESVSTGLSPFELIAVDLKGPVDVEGVGGERCSLT